MRYSSSAGSRSHLFSSTTTSQPFRAAMAAMRSMRKGSVLGVAAEPITTNWSIFATAGRSKAFFRGRIDSTNPSPFPSSRTVTRSPTRGDRPSFRNFPRARQVSTSAPVST